MSTAVSAKNVPPKSPSDKEAAISHGKRRHSGRSEAERRNDD
jgi:hypothetical protein